VRKLAFIPLFIAILVIVLIFFVPKVKAFENPIKEVLGMSTQSLEVNQTIEGPGIFLPHSPFYFLDRFKQSVEVFFTFTPTDKAKIHHKIAGERAAELRAEIVKNQQKGADVALSDMLDNLDMSAQTLDEAKQKGSNVEELAMNFNESIKWKQEMLDLIEDQTKGEMKYKIKAAKNRLLRIKIKNGSLMPEDLYKRELDNDLRVLIEDRISDVSDSEIGRASCRERV